MGFVLPLLVIPVTRHDASLAVSDAAAFMLFQQDLQVIDVVLANFAFAPLSQSGEQVRRCPCHFISCLRRAHVLRCHDFGAPVLRCAEESAVVPAARARCH